MKKVIIGISLALAALTATPTFAATHHSRAMAQPYAGYDAYAAANNGTVINGPAVYSNGRYLGWDPDPAIRLDLLRQGNQVDGGN
jgi:hypothetical protein